MTWSLVCAVMVALDPWALLQAGFWLSFVAVGMFFEMAQRVCQAQTLGRPAFGAVVHSFCESTG